MAGSVLAKQHLSMNFERPDMESAPEFSSYDAAMENQVLGNESPLYGRRTGQLR